MYKTLYSVTVHPIQGDPVTFSDSNTTPGAASAVLAQLTANKDVDSVVDDGGITHVIIPLHAVDYAEVTEQRTESEYEDDNAKNCTEDGEETGTLTIKNAGPVHTGSFEVLFLYDKPGTYGGIDFQVQTEEGYTFITGTIPDLQVGDSIVIDGIPANTQYQVRIGGQIQESGFVPGEVDMVANPQ